jgi:hypothetical protein
MLKLASVYRNQSFCIKKFRDEALLGETSAPPQEHLLIGVCIQMEARDAMRITVHPYHS